jgi:hypothetical protein
VFIDAPDSVYPSIVIGVVSAGSAPFAGALHEDRLPHGPTERRGDPEVDRVVDSERRERSLPL